MKNFIKKLFSSSAPAARRDPADMTIDDVWNEFLSTVRPPSQPRMIETLDAPAYLHVMEWLKPPTKCPMAQAALRALVDCQRTQQWNRLSKLAFVYQSDDKNSLEPPQASVEAVGGLCQLLGAKGVVYWPDGSGKPDSYTKVDITPT